MPQPERAEAHTRVASRSTARPARVEVEPRMLLTDCLRHELGATGTHVGCEHGVCGACTMLHRRRRRARPA